MSPAPANRPRAAAVRAGDIAGGGSGRFRAVGAPGGEDSPAQLPISENHHMIV